MDRRQFGGARSVIAPADGSPGMADGGLPVLANIRPGKPAPAMESKLAGGWGRMGRGGLNGRTDSACLPKTAAPLSSFHPCHRTLKLGSPLQRGRPVSVDPHSYMDRSPARESKDDRRSPSVNRNEIANICDGQQKDDSCGCEPVHDGVFSPKRRRPAAKPHPKQ
jgi:hypothetical protein